MRRVFWSCAEKKETDKFMYWVVLYLGEREGGIQITATTPSACAVRLETGLVDFELSNKPQYTNTRTKKKGTSKYRYRIVLYLNGEGRWEGRESKLNHPLSQGEGKK